MLFAVFSPDSKAASTALWYRVMALRREKREGATEKREGVKTVREVGVIGPAGRDVPFCMPSNTKKMFRRKGIV